MKISVVELNNNKWVVKTKSWRKATIYCKNGQVWDNPSYIIEYAFDKKEDAENIAQCLSAIRGEK